MPRKYLTTASATATATTAAAIFLLASTSLANSGNYSTGAQLGSQPTAAQLAFWEDQERIRNQGNFLHESERRNGGILVIKVSKHIYYTVRKTLREKRHEWLPAPKVFHKPYH